MKSYVRNGLSHPLSANIASRGGTRRKRDDGWVAALASTNMSS